jgi:hypothetical protein
MHGFFHFEPVDKCRLHLHCLEDLHRFSLRHGHVSSRQLRHSIENNRGDLTHDGGAHAERDIIDQLLKNIEIGHGDGIRERRCPSAF